MFRDKPEIIFISKRGFSHPDRKRFARIVAAQFGDKITVEFNDAGQPTFLSQEKEHPSPNDLDHFVSGAWHAMRAHVE